MREDLIGQLIKIKHQIPGEANSTRMVTPEEARYFRAYDAIKTRVREKEAVGEKVAKVYADPPRLDLKVKVIFDEDLRSMQFPRVKQFEFRISSDAPLEIAAKALSTKNEHPQLWRSYSFSMIRKKRIDDEQVEEIELIIEELKTSFGSLKETVD